MPWKLAWEKEKKKKKSQVLPTSSIQTGFRKKKKKSWVKSQFSKSITLCRVRTRRSVLLAEETPKHQRGHWFPLSQAPAAGVAMVTSKLASVHFPRSPWTKGCCQCSRNKVALKVVMCPESSHSSKSHGPLCRVCGWEESQSAPAAPLADLTALW